LRAIGQRDHFFGRGTRRFARGERIVRRPLPAGALPEYAAQAQENEYRQRQKNDGVDVKHVSHAFDNRDGSLAAPRSAGVTTGLTVTIYAGILANP